MNSLTVQIELELALVRAQFDINPTPRAASSTRFVLGWRPRLSLGLHYWPCYSSACEMLSPISNGGSIYMVIIICN